MEQLKQQIREVPDFPKPGILFYDVTTLLKDPAGLHQVIDILTERYQGRGITKVLGIEARGFILAPALAYNLGAGFVPVRKKGKLPAKTLHASYALEYGIDELEIHEDAVSAGEKVLVVDDLIATGGTAAATIQLVRQMQGRVAGLAFLIELTELNGRRQIPEEVEVFSILKY